MICRSHYAEKKRDDLSKKRLLKSFCLEYVVLRVSRILQKKELVFSSGKLINLIQLCESVRPK